MSHVDLLCHSCKGNIREHQQLDTDTFVNNSRKKKLSHSMLNNYLN